MSLKLRRTAVTIAATCGLALTACGSDGDGKDAGDRAGSGSGTASAPSLEDAKAVVLDYFEKFFSGDPAACAHESVEYGAAQDQENDAKDCAERVAAVASLVQDGEPLLDVSKSVVVVNQDADGRAVADVQHELEGSGGVYYLVVQDGVWVIDDEADYGEQDPDPEAIAEDAARTAEWSRAFCEVTLDSTKEEVLEVMGEPTAEETDEDGELELAWTTDQAGFYVWIGEDGTVASTSASGSDPCE